MNARRRTLAALVAAPVVSSVMASRAAAQAPAATDPLFAVELRTGPQWDASRKPHEQAHFREHSANLKSMRDAGHVKVGARYADKGFLVVAAPSEAAVRALMDADPSVQAQVFAYDVHPFAVFYPGCVEARKRGA